MFRTNEELEAWISKEWEQPGDRLPGLRLTYGNGLYQVKPNVPGWGDDPDDDDAPCMCGDQFRWKPEPACGPCWDSHIKLRCDCEDCQDLKHNGPCIPLPEVRYI